jgi:DNA-binding HxlR family transcriptional regulator
MTRSYGQTCPIARTLDIVGERWTFLILRDLYFGATKFSELQSSVRGIPARILSERLKKLEEHGLVEREVYSEHPLRAEYRLTELGRSLRPVLSALAEWGAQYALSARERRQVAKRLPPDLAGEALMSKLRS